MSFLNNILVVVFVVAAAVVFVDLQQQF